MKKLCLIVSVAGLICVRTSGGELPPIQTVFIIMMENHSWPEIRTNANAAYINNTLVPMGSHCEDYENVPGLHPSLPNYLWLEAGTNFGIFDDSYPAQNHQNTTNHLVTLLNNAGISWKAYSEGASATELPLSGGPSSINHTPFIYFDDVTCTNDPACAYGLAHVRPYEELAGDLTNNTVGRYNFIIPAVCHNMHDVCGLGDPVLQGDLWLSQEVPRILNSPAYTNQGALFILFDETDGADPQIPMILLSPLAKGEGASSGVRYTHSSMLRTLQEIFSVGPFLGDAANAVNLSDLFTATNPIVSLDSTNFEVTQIKQGRDGVTRITVSGLATNAPLVLQTSSDFLTWLPVSTNFPRVITFTVWLTNGPPEALDRRFYRFMQSLP